MAASLPPELVAPEDREARAVELERQVAREWLRFGIADGVLALALFAAAFVFTTTDAISLTAFAGILVVIVLLSAALVGYWLARRIRPRETEIAALRSAR